VKANRVGDSVTLYFLGGIKMATSDLILYRKTEELLYKVYPKLVNYPKYERYALSQTIKNCFFSLLQNIALGNSVKSKRKTYLQEVDGYLQQLKILFRLSKKRRYISVGFQREIDIALTEINKLLWGFIRTTMVK